MTPARTTDLGDDPDANKVAADLITSFGFGNAEDRWRAAAGRRSVGRT
jgi:hypothetical protein